MQRLKNLDPMEKSRGMYIIFCAFEYLSAILLSGTFFATLTDSIGISDSKTAIISSITSLACLFQLLSVFIRRGSAKKMSMVMHFIHLVMMMSLYVLPFIPMKSDIRIAVFMVVLIVARFLPNIVSPKRTMWMMSLLDPGRRGRFAATNEIFSLIVGMIFTYVMGAIVDKYRDANDLTTCFLILAGTLAVLLVLNMVSMNGMIEPKTAQVPNRDLKAGMKAVFSNKRVLQVALLFVLWNVAQYVAIPFYATFQIKELGYSLKLVSVLTIIASIARILVSRFWGAYADKHSFAKMISKCFLIIAISFGFVCLAGPGLGKWMFAIYTILHQVGIAGIGSSMTNLIYDYAPVESRADAVAFTTSMSGITGFLTTLAVSPIIDIMQANGNQVFGMTVYAQQIMSAFAMVLTIIILIYIKKVLLSGKKEEKNEICESN